MEKEVVYKFIPSVDNKIEKFINVDNLICNMAYIETIKKGKKNFPKSTDFTKISKARLKEVQDELNDRPRKTLDWDTPHERFAQLLR